MRAAGVRTVVWVTPWVNLDSADGQRPPDPESERLHRRPGARTTPRAPWAGHFVRGPDGRALGRALVDGHRLAGRLHLAAARRWWRSQARAGARAGRRGDQGRRRRGLLHPSRGPLRRRAHAAPRRPGSTASSTGATMQRALDEVHPGTGVLFGRSGWSGQQAIGHHLGRRPGVRLLVAAHAGGRDADRRRERVLELVARRRRLPGPAPGRALPARAAAALGAVRLLHAADAGPRALRAGGVALRPPHARRLPRLRAAPRAARPLHPRRRRDREPLAACRSSDRCASPTPAIRAAGRSPTRTGFGPSLWVAPVLEPGGRARAASSCRAATGSTSGPASRRRRARGRCAEAPRDRIPVWVRRGSIVVTHPASTSPTGSATTPSAARPLEATLWGEPRMRPGEGPARRRDRDPLARRASGRTDGAERPVRWDRGLDAPAR